MQNVLFLCTGNSSRSLMAEAILGRMGKGRFKTFSAGSQPAGQPNPWAIQLLEQFGYQICRLRSKNWSEYSRPGCPQMDHIITVCDRAAGETCPVWPGNPATAHWGIADPAAEVGDDKDMQLAFLTAYAHLSDRIGRFVALPIESMDAETLRQAMQEIGNLSGATGDHI
ncbi:arsenate reductase [Cohaesibacter marisflavi]|uniref:Arsenate reductase n=1 Tax=Cohaesibacter marisflavi TaxID=655353 RepID=A0A1I5EF70_9HYPH|nr:arsenate reductase ArsC [Cohaesibacter marisflavi]SFO09936.1 arsenate reductase [Cohaesibacter marisflavi]